MMGHWDIVEVLLREGHAPDVTGTNGATALMVAAQSGNLESATWKCYHTATPAVGDWNYLSLQLKQLDGDPDVYGMFYNASDAARYPTGNTLGWDFREVSSSSRDLVQLSVQRQRWAHTNAVGVYLCVTAYGDHVTSYELRSMFTKCPGGFTQGEGTEDANSVATVCSAVSGGWPLLAGVVTRRRPWRMPSETLSTSTRAASR